MRKSCRVLTASLLGTSISLGAIGALAGTAGAASTTPAAVPSLPSLPTLPTLTPLCSFLANTPLCGPSTGEAVVQEISSVQNWLQGVSMMLAQKIPTIP